MRKRKPTPLDFEVDKLTNSIENILTGEVFDTEIVRLINNDSRQIKKSDWQFDWLKELNNATKEIYKLTTVNNPTIIQGLISIEDRRDHIFIHLIESAIFNVGREKIYFGVPANLVAFACKISFDKGYEGNVSFIAKTVLKQHYQETLGAKVLYADTMLIETAPAHKLINKYFFNK